MSTTLAHPGTDSSAAREPKPSRTPLAGAVAQAGAAKELQAEICSEVALDAYQRLMDAMVKSPNNREWNVTLVAPLASMDERVVSSVRRLDSRANACERASYYKQHEQRYELKLTSKLGPLVGKAAGAIGSLLHKRCGRLLERSQAVDAFKDLVGSGFEVRVDPADLAFKGVQNKAAGSYVDSVEFNLTVRRTSQAG